VDLLLVDAKNALWRAQEAHPELSAERPDGTVEPTGASYGFLQILCRVHEELGGLVVVCWESWRHPLERKRLFPAYKHRLPDPAKVLMLRDMDRQMVRVMRLLQLAGVRQAYSPGWEADDVMGTLARRLGASGRRATIFTGDRDLFQCIDENTVVVRPQKGGELRTETDETVRAEWGIGPEKWVDLKALAGDKGDNIPGCPGIGPKWAAKILSFFESVDFMLDNLAFWGGSKLPERFREKLLENEANVRLSYKLAKINCEAPLRFIRPQPNPKQFIRELLKLRFKSILFGGRHEQLVGMGG
jgi:DNA polymerase-1